jgi:hypothetical protein
VDLYRTIQILRDEQKRLDRLIQSMEQMHSSGGHGAVPRETAARRGRKSMTGDERRKVSERMKRYWEARRAVASSRDEAQSDTVAVPAGPA